MSVRLQARSHPAGGRIDLRGTYERPLGAGPTPPPLRLVRRRLGVPEGPDDGSVVTDLRDVFATPAQPWARIERFQGLTTNTTAREGVVEGEVTLFHLAPAPAEPVRVEVRLFDPATQAIVQAAVTECSRVARTSPPTPPWAEHHVLQLFRRPGGGAEQPAGRVDLFVAVPQDALAGRFVWTPPGGPARTVEFDVLRRSRLDRTEADDLTYETRRLDTDVGRPWLTVAVRQDVAAAAETWSFTVRDGGLEPGVDYYYGLFEAAATSPLAHAVALASRDYDSPRLLFERLPGAYQRADEPESTGAGREAGPLRRFLWPIGHALDLARSTAEGLRDRHDAFTARADLLPAMSRMIGWNPDLAATADTQRHDVLFAPEIFDGVGTAPNVRALVNRVTAWPCRVKEFVHNVFLTNAPEEIHLWELWRIEHNGVDFGTPAPVTLTTAVDARPAAAVDGAGVTWLFWHSDRNGRRALWRQRLDGVDAAPALARAGAPDDVPGFSPVEEDPAAVWDGTRLWVFWSSNREGQWDLWARTFTGAPPGGVPVRLTDHPAADRSPAVAVVPGAPRRLWLFWSSERRGTADVWSRTLDLSTNQWSDPERLTESPLRDDRPAAAVDAAGRLWLFWTRDEAGRQTLWHRVRDGAGWGAPQPLDVGHARDQAPAAVPWQGGILLLWHSNHDGPWRIWGRFHDGAAWQSATRLDPDVHGNKEPAAVIRQGGGLRVLWRSRRRGRRYRSRTVDVADAQALDAMGTFEDRGHYVYDAGSASTSLHARGTVGLYLTPDTADPAVTRQQVDRAAAFLEPFRPVPVRFAWLPNAPAHVEVITPDTSAEAAWTDVTP